MTALQLDFAGEIFQIEQDKVFTIGRMGDLAISDNPFLHRKFLTLSFADGLWWVSNVGDRVAAQLSDADQLTRTVLSPGARVPLVFGSMLLTFSAGNTGYELELDLATPLYRPALVSTGQESGDTTVGGIEFTESQLLAILVLAEPVLRRVGTGSWQIPTAVEAARRLGWTQTRFNRKLDNVCDKLDRIGVKGLHGGPGKEAKNRRANLVDYAVSSRLVIPEQLPMLEQEAKANAAKQQQEVTQ